MNGLIGGIIFEFLGAALKWIYFHIRCFLTGEKPKSLREIYYGNKSDNDYDVVMISLSNKAIGIIFTMLIVCLILYLNL